MLSQSDVDIFEDRSTMWSPIKVQKSIATSEALTDDLIADQIDVFIIIHLDLVKSKSNKTIVCVS